MRSYPISGLGGNTLCERERKAARNIIGFQSPSPRPSVLDSEASVKHIIRAEYWVYTNHEWNNHKTVTVVQSITSSRLNPAFPMANSWILLLTNTAVETTNRARNIFDPRHKHPDFVAKDTSKRSAEKAPSPTPTTGNFGRISGQSAPDHARHSGRQVHPSRKLKIDFIKSKSTISIQTANPL